MSDPRLTDPGHACDCIHDERDHDARARAEAAEAREFAVLHRLTRMEGERDAAVKRAEAAEAKLTAADTRHDWMHGVQKFKAERDAALARVRELERDGQVWEVPDSSRMPGNEKLEARVAELEEALREVIKYGIGDVEHLARAVLAKGEK